MKDQAAFKETLLCRVQARKAALRRRKKILTACTSFVLCLALLTLILLRPATVQATDLMRGIRPNQVAGEAPDDAFVTTQTDFALRLFQACSRQTAAQNTLVSPLSVMLALAMTANSRQMAMMELVPSSASFFITFHWKLHSRPTSSASRCSLVG